MKKMMIILAMAAAIPLSACNTPGERAGSGALIGAATGAAVGGLLTGRAGGALAGAAIGGLGGAAIGASTAKCARYRYDADGQRYCARYVNQRG
jgi:osmotically inducible lipoprotein OsmB